MIGDPFGGVENVKGRVGETRQKSARKISIQSFTYDETTTSKIPRSPVTEGRKEDKKGEKRGGGQA